MKSRFRFGPPKQTLATTSGRQDLADERAVRGEAVHAVAGRGPDVALVSTRKPSKSPVSQVTKSAPPPTEPRPRPQGRRGSAGAVGFVGAAGVGDVEDALVRREGDAVRLHHVLDDERHRAALRVDAVDVEEPISEGAASPSYSLSMP